MIAAARLDRHNFAEVVASPGFYGHNFPEVVAINCAARGDLKNSHLVW
jgi:hypothetical protein